MTRDTTYTIPELAERIGVTDQSVRNWIEADRIEKPDEIPATGERVYSNEAADRIKKDYMIRAAKGETRGPGAAERIREAQQWCREHGIELTENGAGTSESPPALPAESPAAIVTEEVKEWLVLEDDFLPVAPLAVAVANQLPGPPVWLMIIAPPSYGKSVVIRGITEAIEGARHISSITANTFASGMTDQSEGEHPPSLLERMKEEGEWLLTMKDFGTIQSQPAESRQEIFGQLREIYDGKFNATYGTGAEVDWEGNLGILVGATPAVDRQWQWSAQLGERFVQYRPTRPDDEEVAWRAVEVTSEPDEQRRAIRDAYETAIQAVDEWLDGEDPTNPDLSENGAGTVVALAQLLAEARRPVQRIRGRKGHQVQPAEGPARLAKIFAQVYQAALICYGGDKDCARRFTARVAVDSVPGRRGKALRQLAAHEEGLTADRAKESLGCDKETARRELGDLAAIGLAEKQRRAKTDVFKASEKLLGLAQSVFPEAKNGQSALKKLCDR